MHRITGVLGVVVATVVALVLLVRAGYRTSWTGFDEKALWDWLGLLIIPAVLAAGALLFNWARSRTERRTASERFRGELLQAYLDRMTDLLLDKKLQTNPEKVVREVARVHTVLALRDLDAARNRILLRFLHYSELIKGGEVIHLRGADLRGADLKGADLRGADLAEAAGITDRLVWETSLKRARWRGATKIDLPECVKRVVALVYPGMNLDRIRFYDGLPFYASRRLRAITVGRYVYFREGSFDPCSPGGIALVVHELYHIRQGAGGPGFWFLRPYYLRYVWLSLMSGFPRVPWKHPLEAPAYEQEALVRECCQRAAQSTGQDGPCVCQDGTPVGVSQAFLDAFAVECIHGPSENEQGVTAGEVH